MTLCPLPRQTVFARSCWSLWVLHKSTLFTLFQVLLINTSAPHTSPEMQSRKLGGRELIMYFSWFIDTQLQALKRGLNASLKKANWTYGNWLHKVLHPVQSFHRSCKFNFEYRQVSTRPKHRTDQRLSACCQTHYCCSIWIQRTQDPRNDHLMPFKYTSLNKSY